MVLVVTNLPASAGDIRDAGLIPGSGIAPGRGHGNSLKHSCLENLADRAGCNPRVAKGQTRPKQFSMRTGLGWALSSDDWCFFRRPREHTGT